MWQVSHVTCHVTRVICHISPVTCHVSYVTCNFLYNEKKSGQSGGASRWRVCYQRGLPYLVGLYTESGEPYPSEGSTKPNWGNVPKVLNSFGIRDVLWTVLQSVEYVVCLLAITDPATTSPVPARLLLLVPLLPAPAPVTLAPPTPCPRPRYSGSSHSSLSPPSPPLLHWPVAQRCSRACTQENRQISVC